MTIHERDALSLLEFCRRMGLGKTKAYEEIGSGRLRTVKCGRRRLVPATECVEWMARLAQEGKED